MKIEKYDILKNEGNSYKCKIVKMQNIEKLNILGKLENGRNVQKSDEKRINCKGIRMEHMEQMVLLIMF